MGDAMHESPQTLARLQEIIDRSVATAGPTIRRTFAGPAWSMSAEEFVTFWREGRMASVSTVSARGNVHVAPLECRLVDGAFYIPTFADSQRLKDHRVNARCAISSWEGAYRAAIVYGIAEEVREDPTGRSEQNARWQPIEVLTIKVRPTRIYAIRPPQGHPAADVR